MRPPRCLVCCDAFSATSLTPDHGRLRVSFFCCCCCRHARPVTAPPASVAAAHPPMQPPRRRVRVCTRDSFRCARFSFIRHSRFPQLHAPSALCSTPPRRLSRIWQGCMCPRQCLFCCRAFSLIPWPPPDRAPFRAITSAAAAAVSAPNGRAARACRCCASPVAAAAQACARVHP